MARAVALTDATMEQIRSLAQSLRPPTLDSVGLSAALEGICRSFAGHTRLTIEYVAAELPVLPDMVSITLYRFLQEALTNVARHADARHVRVTLQHDAEAIWLAVEGDGRGFDPPRLADGSALSSMGIAGMRERLQLLGGRLEIDTQLGQGTRLAASVPWKEGV
jgi:signal transduction histidine kinase